MTTSKEQEPEIINKVALCCNDKCNRKKLCMRYALQGNENDTWIEFKAARFGDKLICKKFIHINSEYAHKYILKIYGDRFGRKINTK